MGAGMFAGACIVEAILACVVGSVLVCVVDKILVCIVGSALACIVGAALACIVGATLVFVSVEGNTGCATNWERSDGVTRRVSGFEIELSRVPERAEAVELACGCSSADSL